jgi:hypothetical protein
MPVAPVVQQANVLHASHTNRDGRPVLFGHAPVFKGMKMLDEQT